MNNNENQYSVRRMMRMILVMTIYQYELENKKINVNQVFESDFLNEMFNYKKAFGNLSKQILLEQMKILSIINKNYEKIKSLISNYIREDWTWNRINSLTRSILICACVELKKIDVPIVANEYVEITKDFIPNSEEFKFVNKIIQEIGRLFNAKKNS